MSRANDFKQKFKDSENAPAVQEGITPREAARRLMGAAGTVAMKQKQLRLNCDDMTTKAKKATVEMLEAEGFTVTSEKDPKRKKRVWFVLDWSDPPPDEAVDVHINRRGPKKGP